jgi:thioester reductase-like protein
MAILFTGFPGFLGSELLPRVLRRKRDAKALCVVQSKFLSLAVSRAAALMAGDSTLRQRIEVIEGDITTPGLGLGKTQAGTIDEIFHLAAIYDLSVPRAIGVRVNVEGTRHVLDFAKTCTSFERLHYVSTCYVSGRYDGLFRESDLEKGQSFNNHYEETKYLAEVEVQRRMREGLPVTIYRPAVVVGDSRTGATQKFDGPYVVVQWLLRQRGIAFLPVVGNPKAYRFNVVPRDFIIDAIDYLSSIQSSSGKVYQLADPSPLTVSETIDLIARAARRRVIRVPLTRGLAKGAIDHLPGVYRLMRIPSAAVDYFVHPTTYDTSNSQTDLAGSGIAPPPLSSYVQAMVDFARAHPEIGSSAMA